MTPRTCEPVRINDQSESPTNDLAAYIKNNLKAQSEYNLLYQFKDQAIIIHIDSRTPAVNKFYVYDLNRRGANYLKTAFENAFSNILFVDVGAEKRKERLFEPNTLERITTENAIKEIEDYKIAQALKQNVEFPVTPKAGEWLTHSLFGRPKSDVMKPALDQEKTSQNVIDISRKKSG